MFVVFTRHGLALDERDPDPLTITELGHRRHADTVTLCRRGRPDRGVARDVGDEGTSVCRRTVSAPARGTRAAAVPGVRDHPLPTLANDRSGARNPLDPRFRRAQTGREVATRLDRDDPCGRRPMRDMVDAQVAGR